MDAKYKQYYDRVATYIPAERLYTDDLHCLAWGTDAGFYRRLPQIVVRSTSEDEVSHLLRDASDLQLPVTFRAAGTSLSGQAITDSILIVAGKNWEKYEVAADGSSIKLQPGIVGQRVNEILAPYGKIFSPDPASKKSAMVGGIVMNNASGMNCGTHANSDRELISARLVLADGTQVWMYAGSRLTYPSRFIGDERNVYLQGEAYFKVAKNCATESWQMKPSPIAFVANTR